MSLETSRMEVRNCSISRDLSTERAIECLLNSIVGIRVQPQSVVLVSSSPMLLTRRMIYLRFFDRTCHLVPQDKSLHVRVRETKF